MMQYTAAHYNAQNIDDDAVHCSALQRTKHQGMPCSTLRAANNGDDALHCSTLQHTARVAGCVVVCCSVLQCVAVCCSVLQCVAVCCGVLQCVAVCCSVLQCVAVCCNVLLCVAAYFYRTYRLVQPLQLWGGYD